MVFTSQLRGAWDTMRQLLPAELAEQAAVHLETLSDAAQPYIQTVRVDVNQRLKDLEPAEIVMLTAAALLLAYLALSFIQWLLRPFRERGVAPVIFDTIRSIPFVRALLNKEKAKLRAKILASRADTFQDKLQHLPPASTPAGLVLQRMKQRAQADIDVTGQAQGRCTLSGSVYMYGGEHKQLLDETFAMYSLTNPLHASAFPSVRQMAAEVIAMTAGLLGGGPGGANPHVCGAMTSGGTESILCAVKASRDYMMQKRGIREPEMVVGVSAHAAYFKAAEYFRIKLHVVPVGADQRLHPRALAARVTSNTVLLVASAPGFPHGLVDDVEGIARLARRKGVCLHVDACLGGFCLPFVRRLGRHVPPFDFSVPGVTSISVDTHKFGMAHKGTSVVLYSSPDIRQHQYTRVTDWTGGLYISPAISGSRPGALIATAWASLVHLGEAGFLDATRRILEGRDALIRGSSELLPELEVIGEPEMGIVAWKARDPKRLNVYTLSDWLDKRHWQLNALQSPASIHFCITAANAAAVPELLRVMRQGVDAILADPKGALGGGEGSTAPVYGLSNVSPDRGMLGEFLVAYQDVMLAP